ncbi:MAG: UDP-N-acetylmuramate dehydrogenase [bacterium]
MEELNKSKLNFKKNVLLKKFTTYHIGGLAKYFFIADKIEDLLNALIWAKNNNLLYFLIGAGSNIIISDKDFLGLVIKLGKDFDKIKIEKEKVIVGSAVKISRLGNYLINKGFEGFEFMCGIPGTIGGAVKMNAGTIEGEIKDNIISVKVLTSQLEIKNIKKDNIEFFYRFSNVAEKGEIILGAEWSFKNKAKIKDLKKKVKEILLQRKIKQPEIKKNCGSVFKNPCNDCHSAAWYIEQAGLKGMQIGDAQISLKHANWIVNLGNATDCDVKFLISHIQKVVLEKFNIKLKREVIYIPEDIF